MYARKLADGFHSFMADPASIVVLRARVVGAEDTR